VKIGAVLPVKDFVDAKQRLAVALREAERRLLCEAMVEDVLETLSTVPALSETIVVTRDRDASLLAKRYGARVLFEPSNAGQTAAVTRAAEVLASEGADGLLQVPGDVPAVTAEEISAVLDAHGSAHGATFVPAHDERGTNCVLYMPPDTLPFAFGYDSYAPHCEAARARGIAFQSVRLPGLGLDVDTPEDLHAFLASGVEGRTLTYLHESGIADRITRSRGSITDAA
jgi:2-phospho-L-lactate guanylyltransferase